MRMEQIAAVIHRCHQPHTSMLKNDRSADPRGAPRFSKTLITRSSRWVSDLLRLSFFWPARFFRNRLPFLKLGRRATPPPSPGQKEICVRAPPRGIPRAHKFQQHLSGQPRVTRCGFRCSRRCACVGGLWCLSVAGMWDVFMYCTCWCDWGRRRGTRALGISPPKKEYPISLSRPVES
jgi:hypothetical protein